MEITKKQEKGSVSLSISVPFADMAKHVERAAEKLAAKVNAKGFRPGKMPLDILRREVGDVVVLEEAARLFVQKEADAIIDREVTGTVVGRPNVSLTKLAWDNPVEMTIDVVLLPEVTVPEYKGRNIKLDSTTVDETEVDKVIDDLRESRASEATVERGAQLGDKVLVDIKMFLDNVPVDGGQSQGVAVILGKNYVVPGFDKELLDLSAGQNKEFTLPFPADHHQRNLAGKQVEFSVTVKQVFARNLPEISEDMAKSFGADNLADLRKNIKDHLEHDKFHRNEQKAELQLLDMLLAEAQFGDIPENLIEAEKDTMMQELEHNVNKQGGKLADYLLGLRQTAEDLRRSFSVDAEKRVKSAILLRQIIEREQIRPSDEAVAQEIEQLLAYYGRDPKTAQYLRSAEYARDLKGRLAIRQAMDKLKEWNFADYQPHNHH